MTVQSIVAWPRRINRSASQLGVFNAARMSIAFDYDKASRVSLRGCALARTHARCAAPRSRTTHPWSNNSTTRPARPSRGSAARSSCIARLSCRTPTGRFAFLGPFETNQMGKRELYLWLAVPIESPAGTEPPIVEVNGKALVLGAPGRDADFAGLRNSPYRIPTPWSSMYYYKVDAALVGALGEARNIAVRVTETVQGRHDPHAVRGADRRGSTPARVRQPDAEEGTDLVCPLANYRPRLRRAASPPAFRHAGRKGPYRGCTGAAARSAGC